MESASAPPVASAVVPLLTRPSFFREQRFRVRPRSIPRESCSAARACRSTCPQLSRAEPDRRTHFRTHYTFGPPEEPVSLAQKLQPILPFADRIAAQSLI